MSDNHNLESLYEEARSALKAKDYNRASDLLRQILLIDENYKDTSRLLAQTVKLRRRRWYNHPGLWGTLGVLFVVGLGFFFAPKIQGLYSNQIPSPTLFIPPITSSPTSQPPTATITFTPAPTAIPLNWKRISLGQEFPRDTVTTFATDKNDPDVIYASMENAGVYKSIDGGLSWHPAHQGLANTQVKSLLIDPENTHILYAGTMNGIYKTEDGGENWHRISEGIYLLMDHQNSSHLYTRDESGIYESTDQGRNWEITHLLKEDCPGAIHGWTIHPLDGKVLFVGGWDECGPGIFQSGDGGRTWTLIEMKDKTNISFLATGLDKQDNLSIYAHSNTWGENSGLFVSHDGGKSWHKIGVDCGAMLPDPENPSIIYCARFGLYVTQVKEDTWRRLGLNTMPLSAIHVDHIRDTVRIVAGGTRGGDDKDEGLFISMDGGATWTRRSSGLASARAELKLDPHDATRMYLAIYYYSSYEQISCTLHRSQDTGKSWSEIYSTVGWCGPAFDATGNFFLMDQNAWQKTWDGGDHWWFDGPGYLGPYSLPITSQSVSANPSIDGLMYAVGDEIYFSEHAGKFWQPAAGSKGLWDTRLFYKDQGQTVYAIGRYHQAYSTDSGKTWQNCGEDVASSRSDSRLAIDPQSSRLYLATPGNGVMISTDNCGSWQPGNDGLSNLFVNTLAIDPNNSNTLYAGTDGGAYVSFDAGQTWNQINEGLLGATVVYSIVVDRDSNVYAATPYGVFRLEGK